MNTASKYIKTSKILLASAYVICSSNLLNAQAKDPAEDYIRLLAALSPIVSNDKESIEQNLQELLSLSGTKWVPLSETTGMSGPALSQEDVVTRASILCKMPFLFESTGDLSFALTRIGDSYPLRYQFRLSDLGLGFSTWISESDAILYEHQASEDNTLEVKRQLLTETGLSTAQADIFTVKGNLLVMLRKDMASSIWLRCD